MRSMSSLDDCQINDDKARGRLGYGERVKSSGVVSCIIHTQSVLRLLFGLVMTRWCEMRCEEENDNFMLDSAEYTLDRNRSTQSNLISLFTLNPRHQGNLLWTLYDVRTVFLPYQLAVLKEALVARETVGEIAKGDQSKAPDASTTEFTLVFHPVRAVKDAAAVKPALHEFTLVPGIIEWRKNIEIIINIASRAHTSWSRVLHWAVRKIHYAEAWTNAISKGAIFGAEETGKAEERDEKGCNSSQSVGCVRNLFQSFFHSYRIAFHLAITNVPGRASDLSDSTRRCNDFHLLE